MLSTIGSQKTNWAFYAKMTRTEGSRTSAPAEVRTRNLLIRRRPRQLPPSTGDSQGSFMHTYGGKSVLYVRKIHCFVFKLQQNCSSIFVKGNL
jgi:hypothetical protein